MALSSPPGPSSRAVVRLSGARAHELAEGVFAPLPERGFCWTRGELRLPAWPTIPGEALSFRAPRSYSGEDVVELCLPGAPPLIRRLLLVLEEAGARQARPGEFTRRAFLHGRIDLTQAEAVLLLTSSEEVGHARAALRALEGGVSRQVDQVKAQLLDVLAHVEAAIDFSEEDIDLTAEGVLAARLEQAAAGLERLRASCQQRPQAGTTPRVVLLGPANAGKSTLLNALSGRGAAIVSGQAGTTRDVLAVPWTLPGGSLVLLQDTAGSLLARDEVEGEALELALAAGESADLRLFVVEAGAYHQYAETFKALAAPKILLLSKVDLGVPEQVPELGVRVSGLTKLGLEQLAQRVADVLGTSAGAPTADLIGTARQEGLLTRASKALGCAAEQLRGHDPARTELGAVDIQEGLGALGELTGVVTTEDVLDRIFGQFCIGK